MALAAPAASSVAITPMPEADINKMEIPKRLAAEFGQKHACAGVRTATPAAAQIVLCDARVEEP